jgi:signal transduction histidine kinase
LGIGLYLIFFIYGLSFWAMGLAVLLETGRIGSRRQARSLYWLAGFGILHGSHEWFEASLLQSKSLGAVWPSWLEWARLAILAVSFGCLYLYAVRSLMEVKPPRRPRRWHYVLPLIVATYVACAAAVASREAPIQWTSLSDSAARYVLAVPSAALASLALVGSARSAAARDQARVAANLRLGAIGFAVYGASQALVPPQPWFPASLINHESFLSVTGVPIQGVRAAVAALISFGLLRAMQAVERQRQTDWIAANQARLAAVKQRETLRRDLLRHVVRSQEDERARIARELHDQIAQLLSAFSLDLGALRSKLKRADLTQTVGRLQEQVRDMSQALYDLVRDLRPSHLDSLGLVPALKFLGSEEYGPKGLEVEVRVTGKPRPLGGLVDTGLFRVAQESLTNVLRHAHVAQAEIEVLYDGDRVCMRVRDRGCGFDPDADFNPPRGWGLAGMRERVEALSGRFALRTAPDEGTTVEAVIPLGAGEKDATHG